MRPLGHAQILTGVLPEAEIWTQAPTREDRVRTQGEGGRPPAKERGRQKKPSSWASRLQNSEKIHFCGSPPATLCHGLCPSKRIHCHTPSQNTLHFRQLGSFFFTNFFLREGTEGERESSGGSTSRAETNAGPHLTTLRS